MNEHESLFRVRLWCRDCSWGQDPMGCFDGGTALATETKAPWSVLTFQTLDEAKSAGWDRTADAGPYEFHVLDEDDQVVFSSDA